VIAQDGFSDPQMLTGVMALAPHAAYHLGAIRQMIAAPVRTPGL
jgi:hypothetical protein